MYVISNRVKPVYSFLKNIYEEIFGSGRHFDLFDQHSQFV